MTGGFDRNRSLQDLEGVDWEEPTHDSGLVTTCHRLRRKPLGQFTAADFRIMIGQQISLPYLIPPAVEQLERDPLVEASYFRGDLLAVVLHIEEPFWNSHPDSFMRVREIIKSVMTMLPSLDEIAAPSVSKVLAEASDAFGRSI